MDAGTILILGALLLSFGSVSLFMVRSSNKNLKGLGWLGTAFVAGAGGAGTLLLPRTPHVLSALLPDVLVLLSFVLLQVATDEVFGKPLFPRLGLVLLCAMSMMDILYTDGRVDVAFRISCISVLVALQCGNTAWQLWQYRRELKSALFCSVMLLGFAGFNLGRAILVGTGLSGRWRIDETLMSLTFLLFVLEGLGLAFGFFWLTNACFACQLEEVAALDPLTHIYNRRTLLRACEKELRVSARKARPFSILMADLDHFKSINDRFGHDVGDEALVAVVESMQNSIRGIDVLGRWGGEEFVVLLPNASEEAARIVAERMRANVERLELRAPLEENVAESVARLIRMTVSVGLATFQPQDDLHTMIRRADQCLYLAKGAGRNCVLQAG